MRCHPLIALSIFYLIDLMHNADYSPAGALLVLAAKSMCRVVRLLNKGFSGTVAFGIRILGIHKHPRWYCHTN